MLEYANVSGFTNFFFDILKHLMNKISDCFLIIENLKKTIYERKNLSCIGPFSNGIYFM
jgi:hypothetical protein